MPSGSECSIFFNNSDGVFSSGSSVSGRFELITTSIKTIRGIVVRVTGTANVYWQSKRTYIENGSREISKTTEYINNESYLHYEKYVLGSKYSDNFELNPGTYNYNFNCDLPPNLPSSFKGKYGEIFYEVCIEIDQHDIVVNNKFHQAFTVIYALNLNLNPEYRQSKIINDEVQNTCFISYLFGKGKVKAEITIPYGGYIPGQDIPYKLLISNDTNSDLNKISKVELIRKVTFESQIPKSKFKYSEVTLNYKDVGHVLKLSKKEFQNILEIPSTVPTTTPINLSCCIQIEYFVKAEIVTGYCANNLQLIIPIVIGISPLITSNEVTFSQSSTPSSVGRSLRSLNNLDLPPGYIEPPSYDDAKILSQGLDIKRTGDKQLAFTQLTVFFSK